MLQGIAYSQHALYFANHIACALVFVAGNLALHLVQHLHGGIAQRVHFGMCFLDDGSHVFALQATLVVGRPGQFMLYTAVDQQQLVALRIPGEILVFAAAAVETHQGAGFSEYAGKLVHDTAVAAHILVLCALAHTCQLHLFNLVFSPEVVECEGIGALQCGRAAHACSQRYITGKGSVESLHGNTQLHHFAAYAEDIACPGGIGTLWVVQ